jgi:hypothetical protein
MRADEVLVRTMQQQQQQPQSQQQSSTRQVPQACLND